MQSTQTIFNFSDYCTFSRQNLETLMYTLSPLTVTKLSTVKNSPVFYRAMLCIRSTSHGPVSVRLSVTSRSSTKTDKQRITQTTPYDSPGTLVF